MNQQVWKPMQSPLLTCRWIIAMLVFVTVAAACGDTTDELTPEPTPTLEPTGTSTTAPVPTPSPASSTGVDFWDLDETSTGQDLIALLTPEEASCLEDRLGASFERLLQSSLVGEAGDLLAGDGSSPSPATECFTKEHTLSASVAMLNIAAGGLSAETQGCIGDLLQKDPSIIEALGQADDSNGSPVTVALQLFACLTPEEAAAMTPPGEGPGPNPTDIACLIRELEGASSGERIIAVLSGADTSGAGLTMEESAMLGQAVEACGVETDFDFPDPAGTGSTDDTGANSP